MCLKEQMHVTMIRARAPARASSEQGRSMQGGPARALPMQCSLLVLYIVAPAGYDTIHTTDAPRLVLELPL